MQGVMADAGQRGNNGVNAKDQIHKRGGGWQTKRLGAAIIPILIHSPRFAAGNLH